MNPNYYDLQNFPDDICGPWMLGGTELSTTPANFPPLFCDDPILQDPLIAMADALGYVVLRGAIPKDLAEEAGCAVHIGLETRAKRDKYYEFQVPPIGHKVCETFLKNNQKALQDFFAPTPLPEKPSFISVGMFRSVEKPDPEPRSTFARYVFATIALTRLNAESGWYTICEGSHQLPPNTMSSKLRKRDKSLDLLASDAIIWRSELGIVQSSGGDGKFETLVYKL